MEPMRAPWQKTMSVTGPKLPMTARSTRHHWGAALIESLPKGLNRDQSPDGGAAGLERRGTPARAGQRTLEAQKPKPPF